MVKEDNGTRSFRDYMKEVVGKVLRRMENGEVPVSGAFPRMIESFQNPDEASRSAVGRFALSVYKMGSDIVTDTAMRFVEAAAYTPDGSYKSSRIVASGTNQEIVETLRSSEFPDELEDAYAQLLDIMESSD